MARAYFPSVATACALAVLTSCQSATPATSTSLAPVAAAPVIAKDQYLAAIYNLRVDPATQSAELTPLPSVREAQFQALNFDLDIAAFMKRDTFRITGVAMDVDGDLQVEFSHRHPFAAPNLGANPTAQNRADLGYTGRVLLIREVPLPVLPTAEFFDDGSSAIITDWTLVKDADGYLHPGDLLRDPVLLANTFPYVLLADDAKNNRVGESNGGDPKGNYDDTPGGWQRASLEVNPTGWTGYDFIHAGQEVVNSFTLRREALQSGPFDLQVALVIKYSQPSGAPPRTNRQLHFPQQPTNVTSFAYRLPYAALDASQSALAAPVVITPGIGSTASLSLSLRDWDSLGIEAGDADLSDETDVTLIQPGAAGQPTATVSAPLLSATEFPLIPVSSSVTGIPGDEISYAGDITNTLGTAGLGTVPALVRFIDPEDGDPTATTYRFGVDPLTLVADPARALQVRTYQLVPVTVGDPAPVITSVSPGGTIGVSGTSVMFSAVASGSPTSWSWDFGGGAAPNTSTSATPTVSLEAPGTYNGTVTATNGFGPSDPFPFSFTVGLPTLPTWNKHLVLDTGSVGRFSSIIPYGTGFAIAHGGLSPTPPQVTFTTNPNPTSAADWSTVVVDALSVTSAIYMEPVLHAGRLFVIYASGNPNQDIMCGRANVAAPAIPATFSTYAIDTNGNPMINIAAVESSTGVLLVGSSRTSPAPAGLRFNYALTPDPQLPSDWANYDAAELVDVASATGSFTMGTRIIIYNGNPVMSFGSPTGATLRGPWIARATVPVPTAKAQWTLHNVENTGTSVLYNTVAVTNNRLAVCYYDGTPNNRLRFSLAAVAEPASSADWTTPITIDGGGGINAGLHNVMANIGGRLAITYYDSNAIPGAYRIARALSTSPDLLPEWQLDTIEFNGVLDPGEFGKALLDSNGYITVSYMDDLNDDLWFARASTTW